jgi:N-methylhydantoinase B
MSATEPLGAGAAADGGAAERMDPITFAVLFSALHSVVEEMSLTFEHSAWSSILAQCRDFSCAVYDAGSPPNAMCVFDGLPVHVHSQPMCLAAMTEFFEGDIGEGDVILANSPYFGTTHIGDLVAVAPVFWEGELVFWAAATGHQMDVGSAYNTSVPVQASDIWKEGFQISPVKLEEGGRLRKDVLELYLGNVRHRDFLYGDLMSQIASVKTGRDRMLELLERWGPDQLKEFGAEVIEYADRRTAAQIAEMPDGTYRSETWVDSDAVGGTNVKVQCALTIDGSDVHIDFAGSGPASRSGVNASWSTCVSSAATPVFTFLDPDIPHNQGCIRHITVDAEPGTITRAQWPASTASATIVPGDAIGDAVWRCLAQALPDRAVAGCGRIAPNAMTAGFDRRVPGVEIPFGVILFNCSSGGGATPEFDGWPLMYDQNALGGMKILPIEVLELHYPLIVRRHEIREDSMGAGRTRGGPGLHFETEVRGTGQVDVYGFGDGIMNPPFGAYGGLPGDGGALYRNEPDGSRTFFSAISYFRVKEGQSWVSASSGGGGYGDPLERAPELVRADVRDGYTSRDAAERLYGVVLDAEGGAVDAAATAARRAEPAGRRSIAVIDPESADAGTYQSTLMGSRDTYVLNPHPPADADFTL